MINNESLKEHLLLYLDDALPEAETHEIEARLAEDPDLRKELACLQRIRSAIQQRPPESSPDLWDGIEHRIQEDAMGNIWLQLEWVGKRLVPLFAVAAAVMLAVLSSFSTEDTTVTLDDYFQNQESLVLSEASFSHTNVLGMNTSETTE